MRQAEAYFLPVLNLQGHGPDQLAVHCSTGRWEGTEWAQSSAEAGCWKLSGQEKSPDRDKGVFRWHKSAGWPLFVSSISRVWSICLRMSYTEARLLCSWPKSSHKQQAHFTNTAPKTCILKNKVIFHWSPALPTAPFKWPVPNDSVRYDLAYLKRGTCNKIPHWEVVWAHTTPGIFLWPQLPVQDSCFENGRDLVFLALLCDGRKL